MKSIVVHGRPVSIPGIALPDCGDRMPAVVVSDNCDPEMGVEVVYDEGGIGSWTEVGGWISDADSRKAPALRE